MRRDFEDWMDEVTIEAPTFEDIARLAYARYTERGGQNGHDLDDWLEAERELMQARERRTIARSRPVLVQDPETVNEFNPAFSR